jgi:hypothetical protein
MMNLTYIDNGFYKLTPAQAKELCMGNVLPRHGYEMRADRQVLENVKIGKIDYTFGPNGTWREFPFLAKNAHSAWVLRTKLSSWQGKEIKNGWTWALHLCY